LRQPWGAVRPWGRESARKNAWRAGANFFRNCRESAQRATLQNRAALREHVAGTGGGPAQCDDSRGARRGHVKVRDVYPLLITGQHRPPHGGTPLAVSSRALDGPAPTRRVGCLPCPFRANRGELCDEASPERRAHWPRAVGVRSGTAPPDIRRRFSTPSLIGQAGGSRPPGLNAIHWRGTAAPDAPRRRARGGAHGRCAQGSQNYERGA
jgi:hypothetical protein